MKHRCSTPWPTTTGSADTDSHRPGRQGAGADPRPRAVLGEDTFRSDVLVAAGLDDRSSSSGYLKKAEQLMADAVGAEHAFFSTCGSSLSVKAAMLAVARSHHDLLVSRDAHKSVVAGLIFSGVQPRWIPPRWDADLHLTHAPSPAASISMADTERTGQRLVTALEELIAAAPSLPAPPPIMLPDPSGLELDTVTLPRDAFLGATENVWAADAAGRVSAEQITPYPPGIPAIIPGERITAEVIDYLRTGLQAGMVLPDPADPTLKTIRVTAA